MVSLSPHVFFLLVSWGGLRLSPLGTSAAIWPIDQPRMIDDECGAVDGMRIGRGNRSTRRKPAPVSLCPPQISRPHMLITGSAWSILLGHRIFIRMYSQMAFSISSLFQGWINLLQAK
jgi:hypothetical protein